MTQQTEESDLVPDATGDQVGTPSQPRQLALVDLGSSSSTFQEKLIEIGLTACGFVSVAVMAAIVITLIVEAATFFSMVSFSDFFGGTEWTPLFAEKHFGVWPLICGTLLTTAIALVVAIPLGVLAAIYLSEIARPRTRGTLKPALELLAGVPTVVYGFFALIVVTPLLKGIFPEIETFNALAPGLVMGIMIVPYVASLSEDALHAVPDTLREASYGLGAGRFSTITRVVVPAASSGIVAAVLLALARAIGETMIVTIAAGSQPQFGLDPMSSTQTMTAFIVQVSTGDAEHGTASYQALFSVAATLFVFTYAINWVSQRFVRRYKKKGGG